MENCQGFNLKVYEGQLFPPIEALARVCFFVLKPIVVHSILQIILSKLVFTRQTHTHATDKEDMIFSFSPHIKQTHNFQRKPVKRLFKPFVCHFREKVSVGGGGARELFAQTLDPQTDFNSSTYQAPRNVCGRSVASLYIKARPRYKDCPVLVLVL